jgi:hypothetical protein
MTIIISFGECRVSIESFFKSFLDVFCDLGG